MTRWKNRIAPAVLSALIACGGGGEGGGAPPVAAPTISQEPSDTTALEGAAAAFTVAHAGEVTSVRWQRDGTDLPDGASAGATVSGAGTVSLALSALPLAWSGSTFRAVVSGPGGSATSRTAALTVEPRTVSAFFTDFEEAALVSQIAPGTAPAQRDDVQDFAGLGNGAEVFAGQFLRSPTGNTVTLTLSGLAPHVSLDLDLLLAAIDSLDGTGAFPAGDFFTVTVDGVQVFRESFANATSGQVQSYVPPPGVELARRVDLGFGGPGGFYTDSAYDLGADPAFAAIPHTASTVTVTFLMEGPGIQPLDDESWAMDRLRVTLNR